MNTSEKGRAETASFPPPHHSPHHSPHHWRVRVYYEDTDFSGVVYHANYLKFAERARTEYLRALGIGQQALAEAAGVYFTARHCAIDFLKPARLDDELIVTTSVESLTGARLVLDQRLQKARADGAGEHVPIATLSITLACIKADGGVTRLPEAVRDAFTRRKFATG